SSVSLGANPDVTQWPQATGMPSAAPVKQPAQVQASIGERGTDTIRVSTAKLDGLLLQAEELLSAKLTAGYRAAELRELTAAIATWAKEWTKVRSDVRTMQQVIERDEGEHQGLSGQHTGSGGALMRNLLEFLDWNQSF